MPNNNITTITTKIVLRNDILDNWKRSKVILEKGEPALEMDPERMTAKIKIGDGIHTFNELPYSSVSVDDIQEMIDNSMVESGAISSVVLNPGTKNGTLKLVINDVIYDNIAVTGLGSAAYTNTYDYATAEQGARAEKAMVYKGVTKTLPTDVEAGDTYTVENTFVIPDYKSATGEKISVYYGDTIIMNAEGKWSVMPKGIADAAKTLTEGISANITGGATGQASAANAGETMNIEITEINTDFLTQGTKVIILNGGNAAT